VIVTLRGAVEAGAGQGATFMSLDWVRDGIARIVGFEPYPGTLNVRLVDGEMLERWRRIRRQPGLALSPPAPDQCGARLFPVVVSGDVPAAVIVPDLTRYGAHVLEIVAPVHLRTRLWLRNHDLLTLTYDEPLTGSRSESLRSEPRP
jgi:riboflavin kinase